MIAETRHEASHRASLTWVATSVVSPATNVFTASFQYGIGRSPRATDSRHFRREFFGRGAGRLSAAMLVLSSSFELRRVIANAARAKSSKLAPSPEFTTW